MTTITAKQLKQIYINSRLHPLPVATPARLPAPREWIFSQGDRWLLLTPPRLSRLAAMLGIEDARVGTLVHEVRRWHPHPENFCRMLGIEEVGQPARNCIPVVCPGCDNVHYPHPEDALRPCPDCAAKSAGEAPIRTRARDAEKRRDKRARERLLRADPSVFDETGALHPNWKINQTRRFRRDWDNAVNRILLGQSYRRVAREFECSVGLLHKKVEEAKHWEWN